ncbi:MAG: hypothetical protein H7Y89_02400 [Steroidobacteraceae bacterium]|nr:hypothetical protein [Steroidobacteraceae bacterium]
MKTLTMIVSKGLLIVLLLAPGAARSQNGAVGDELAVVQAMATILNESARPSYDYLYFESEFPASPIVAESMSNPDRTEFCGLSRDDAQSLVGKLVELTEKPIEFDDSLAKPAGLRLGHKKLPRFRYLTLSRVVFAPDLNQAWVAVNLNGMSGAVMRLDKIDGRWNKTARCGGWYKPE